MKSADVIAFNQHVMKPTAEVPPDFGVSGNHIVIVLLDELDLQIIPVSEDKSESQDS